LLHPFLTQPRPITFNHFAEISRGAADNSIARGGGLRRPFQGGFFAIFKPVVSPPANFHGPFGPKGQKRGYSIFENAINARITP
jgi:hypothetical protein